MRTEYGPTICWHFLSVNSPVSFMAGKNKETRQPLTNNEIRTLMLRYFYDRNSNATSSRGKKGSSVKISDMKRELKTSHGMSQQENAEKSYLPYQPGLG